MRPGAAMPLFALVLAHPVAVSAQGAPTPVRTGFIPDPLVIEGTTSGERALRVAGPADCEGGFFPAAPSHRFAFETRFGFLRLYAIGPGDLALAVRDAEGLWHCSDDRFGRHPSVEGAWLAGRIEVYVGTHTSGERSDYELRLTETRSVRPGVADGGDPGDERGLAHDAGMAVDATSGRFDGIRLRRGFLPDPRFLAGDAAPEEASGRVDAGRVDAGVLGGECHGVVTSIPSHTVELLDDFDFFQIYLVPLEGTRWGVERPPISIVALFPDGTFECDTGNADGIEISRARWGPGLYRIWVGLESAPRGDAGSGPETDAETPRVPYRLGLSEIRRVR